MAPDPRPPFATYLLPSFSFPFPFRNRQSSTSSSSAASVPSLSSSPTSSASTTPSSSPPSLYSLPVSNKNGKSILQEIPQTVPKAQLHVTHPNTLKCLACASDIAFASQIVSKGFTGRHGRAYLVSPPPYTSKPSLGTSTKSPLHTPTDLINTRTGRSATRELLTGTHIVADVSCGICGTVLGWKYVDAKEKSQRYKIGKFILEMKRVVLGTSWEDDGVAYGDGEVAEEEDGEVVFNSEDEDECDDLFAGVWDREVVGKRRSRRIARLKRDGDDEV